MSFCVPSFQTRLSDPLLHPSAPRPGVEWLLQPHVATHHAAGRQLQGFLTHTSITPLPHQARASRVWHAKCGAIACRFACLLCSHVTTSQTHCSTQALLAQGSRGSVSARHAVTHDAAGRQTQAFLTFTSITPLPYQAPASNVWHAKCSAIA